MLLLYSLLTGETANLVHWLNICPRKQFTTLDTHDGIGVVDARGLLTDEQIERTKDLLFLQGANVKRIYNTEAYKNLDIYQIKCTYYSALGNQDDAYIIARAVQIFAPGIPQVYYVGLLAGQNDIKLVESAKNGRDINRHTYTIEEITKEIERIAKTGFNCVEFWFHDATFDGSGCATEQSKDATVLRQVCKSNGVTINNMVVKQLRQISCQHVNLVIHQ